MKRGRLPLTALRAASEAPGLASITLAAEELFVSQAAISRQIRGLEEQLGQALFERRHRAVKLTPAGRDLLDVLIACFDRMEGAVQATTSTPAARALVRISVEPPSPRGGSCPPCRISTWLIRISTCRSIPIRASSVFAAMARCWRCGFAPAARSWPKTQARLPYDCEMAVVAAPSLLSQRGMPQTLPDPAPPAAGA